MPSTRTVKSGAPSSPRFSLPVMASVKHQMSRRGGRTDRKLEEAEFFFSLLEPNVGKLKKFDFFLSAFITSARSVLWIMRAEYSKVPDWEEWYQSQAPDDQEAALLQGTNDLRVRTEKIEPIQTASTITVQGVRLKHVERGRFQELMASAQGKKIPIKISGTTANCTIEMEIDGEHVTYSAGEMFVAREVKEFPDQDILEISRAYISSIRRVVNACHEKFDA